jgi:hypothetical protein
MSLKPSQLLAGLFCGQIVVWISGGWVSLEQSRQEKGSRRNAFAGPNAAAARNGYQHGHKEAKPQNFPI